MPGVPDRSPSPVLEDFYSSHESDYEEENPPKPPPIEVQILSRMLATPAKRPRRLSVEEAISQRIEDLRLAKKCSVASDLIRLRQTIIDTLDKVEWTNVGDTYRMRSWLAFCARIVREDDLHKFDELEEIGFEIWEITRMFCAVGEADDVSVNVFSEVDKEYQEGELYRHMKDADAERKRYWTHYFRDLEASPGGSDSGVENQMEIDEEEDNDDEDDFTAIFEQLRVCELQQARNLSLEDALALRATIRERLGEEPDHAAVGWASPPRAPYEEDEYLNDDNFVYDGTFEYTDVDEYGNYPAVEERPLRSILKPPRELPQWTDYKHEAMLMRDRLQLLIRKQRSRKEARHIQILPLNDPRHRVRVYTQRHPYYKSTYHSFNTTDDGTNLISVDLTLLEYSKIFNQIIEKYKKFIPHKIPSTQAHISKYYLHKLQIGTAPISVDVLTSSAYKVIMKNICRLNPDKRLKEWIKNKSGCSHFFFGDGLLIDMNDYLQNAHYFSTRVVDHNWDGLDQMAYDKQSFDVKNIFFCMGFDLLRSGKKPEEVVRRISWMVLRFSSTIEHQLANRRKMVIECILPPNVVLVTLPEKCLSECYYVKVRQVNQLLRRLAARWGRMTRHPYLCSVHLLDWAEVEGNKEHHFGKEPRFAHQTLHFTWGRSLSFAAAPFGVLTRRRSGFNGYVDEWMKQRMRDPLAERSA